MTTLREPRELGLRAIGARRSSDIGEANDRDAPAIGSKRAPGFFWLLAAPAGLVALLFIFGARLG